MNVDGPKRNQRRINQMNQPRKQEKKEKARDATHSIKLGVRVWTEVRFLYLFWESGIWNLCV
jgi:hypothetical protein